MSNVHHHYSLQQWNLYLIYAVFVWNSLRSAIKFKNKVFIICQFRYDQMPFKIKQKSTKRIITNFYCFWKCIFEKSDFKKLRSINVPTNFIKYFIFSEFYKNIWRYLSSYFFAYFSDFFRKQFLSTVCFMTFRELISVLFTSVL